MIMNADANVRKSKAHSTARTAERRSAEQKAPAILPPVGFVRLPTVLSLFPVGRSTWWAGIRDGKFPAPVKLGPRVSAWRVADIRALLASYERRETEGR